MVGTRTRRGDLEKQAQTPTSAGRADRAAKRKKAQEAEEQERKEEERLAEEERAQELEHQKTKEGRNQQTEKYRSPTKKRRKKTRVLEEEYAPEAASAIRLSEPPSSGRLGLVPSWVANLNKLKDFKKKFGHCRVPRRYDEEPNLGPWVWSQRRCFLQQKLSNERFEKLEELGFEFALEPDGITWDDLFNDLKQFKEKSGNLDLPSGYDESPQLLYWTFHQRELYRKGQLSEEHKAKLESLGFGWEHKWPTETAPTKSLEEIWRMQFDKLARFKEQNGHTDIPSDYKHDPTLIKWVRTQRNAHKRNLLTQQRKEALESLGLDLGEAARTPRNGRQQEGTWNTRLQDLKKFKEEFGHCNVAGTFARDPVLARWVGTQRTSHRRNQMSDDRIEALEALGFVWRVSDSSPAISAETSAAVWNTEYEKLRTYHELNGNCNVPRDYGIDPQFARWVWVQRRLGRGNKLKKERKDSLDLLGFDWHLELGSTATADLGAIWQMQFEKLRVFKMANGHCNVPCSYGPDPAFSRWVSTQRTVHRRSQMHADRKAALESLGFEWKLMSKGRTWEESLNALKEFKQSHGHCFVPANADDSALRNWCVHQRQKYNKGQLPAGQIDELEPLGFAWNAEQEKQVMWDVRFNQLSNFSQDNGHCGLPTNFPEDPDILEWISCQHSAYFAKKLSPERIERLVSIGFVFNHDSVTADGDKKPAASNQRISWNKHYNALLQFKEASGHANVPSGYFEDPRLANWVANQRKLYRRGQGPTQERIEKLNAIGFDWTLESRRSSFGMPELKPPPVAAAVDTGTPGRESEAIMAAAEGLTAASRPPQRSGSAATGTPTMTWARGTAMTAQTTTAQQGVQQMAVNLEVARKKLDTENKNLRRANQKLETENKHLTKRLTNAETAFRKETQELKEKLQQYDEMLGTQAETLQHHGQQLQQLAQSGEHGSGDQLREQASTLETQGNQLTQLAQQVQEMRQMQYTLQHQVGVQNLTYRV